MDFLIDVSLCRLKVCRKLNRGSINILTGSQHCRRFNIKLGDAITFDLEDMYPKDV